MEFGWDEDIVKFRQEVLEFIQEVSSLAEVQELITYKKRDGDEPVHPGVYFLRSLLDDRGWLKMCWPKELGGEGKSYWYQFILSTEMLLAEMPYELNTAEMVAPAINNFGTEEQKAEYVPALWAGDITVALGYSEPNAGTDLAALQTSAVRDGDEWVINGQKIWTSLAHLYTHVWLAVRTDKKAPKHRGISMMMVPLDSEGITVRNIELSCHNTTNEVFFDDVRVPAGALIGEENRGWYIAAHSLDHERVVLGKNSFALQMAFGQQVEYLRTKRPEQLQKTQCRLGLANLKVDLHIARALTMINASIIADGNTPTMEASMSKVWTSELRYRMADAGMNQFGRAGGLRSAADPSAPMDGWCEDLYRASPVRRFGGGTNEVQRGIIAQRGLGLPRQ